MLCSLYFKYRALEERNEEVLCLAFYVQRRCCLTSLPATGLGRTSAPATRGLVRPSAARWCGVNSSNLLLLPLDSEGLALSSELRWSTLLLELREGRVVSTATLSSFLMVIVLEAADTTRVNSSVLLVLHGGIGIRHASLRVSVVTHTVGLSTVSTVLGVVLILILIVAVGVSASVSAASATALVLVTTG